MTGRRMILGLNIDPIGHHNGAWRHPATDLGRIHDIAYLGDLARLADENGLDAIFIADGLSYRIDAGQHPALGFEPLTLFAHLAAVTRRVGLICTVSSSFTEPYNLARAVSSLDRISAGRAAWNVVTTANDVAPLNYNLTALPAHADRYRRAQEYIEVVQSLWDGWDADAIVGDKAAGRFIDPAKVHATAHDGAFFRVAGPLNMPRSPQGRPVIVQAGASEAGRDFSSRHAELVYVVAQRIEDAVGTYRDLKARAAAHGRDPDDLRIILAIRVLVAADNDAALRRERELAALIPHEQTLRRISDMIAVPLDVEALDSPIPPLPAPETSEKFQTQLRMIRDLVATGEVVTLRDLAERMNGGQGVASLAGDPITVADGLEAWFTAGAADGFMILPQVTQLDAANFVAGVLPELARRGLHRPVAEALTFRERLGR